MKNKIKKDIINLYMKHWKSSSKDFNEIIKYLTRQNYPHNYPELHQFMGNVLNTLTTQDLNSFINSEELLPFLSTVKVIMKEYSIKKITHSK